MQTIRGLIAIDDEERRELNTRITVRPLKMTIMRASGLWLANCYFASYMLVANCYEGRYYRQIAPRKGDASPFSNGPGDSETTGAAKRTAIKSANTA